VGKWEPPGPEVIARFAACLPKDDGIERRRMFGCPCAFINGNMFAGVHEQRVIVRLDDPERAALAAQEDVRPFTVMGRTMREYVAFERPLQRTPRELSAWLRKALAYAASLPPRTVAPKRAAKAPRTARAGGGASRRKPQRA